MKWDTLGNPFQQLTVDSNWIPNTIRNIQDNTNALKCPKVLPYGKNILTMPEINHTVIHSLPQLQKEDMEEEIKSWD